MTTLYAAEHEIHLRIDDQPQTISPGELFVPVASDIQNLMRGGAIREPTETELSLYELTKARTAATSATDEIQ